MDSLTEEYWYAEVKLLEEVPLNLRQAAEKAKKFCIPYLGLPDVEVIWFRKIADWEKGFAKMDRMLNRSCWKRPTTFQDADISGQVRSFNDNIIWVSLALSQEEVTKTVAHEMRHLWQLQRYRPPVTLQEKDRFEKDATEFERIAWRALK